MARRGFPIAVLSSIFCYTGLANAAIARSRRES
jgi:hypothetical protein